MNEKKLPSGLSVRYLYQPGELEGGRRRATDPIWSLNVYEIEKIMIKPDAPVIYYLFDGPKRWFVREELLVVPPNIELPPEQLYSSSAAAIAAISASVNLNGGS